jgi:hypothetical protein
MAATQASTAAAASGNGYGTPRTAHQPAAAMRNRGLRQIRLGGIWFTIGW